MKTFLFDMGLPMIVPSMFLMTLALLPIILVESYAIAASLRLKLWNILKWVALGNAASTFLGIPITWFLLTALQIVTGGGNAFKIDTFWGKLFAFTLQAPWIAPSGPELDWRVYAAMIFLLVPFCFASWCVEYLTMRRKIASMLYQRSIMEGGENDQELERLEIEGLYPQVSRAVRNANFISYSILALFVVGMLLAGLPR